MPSSSPSIHAPLASRLAVVGERIRAHRKAQKVSATVAAEAAGLSRVTLHRIERGEPSVTMGAYLNVIAAVGLDFDLVDPQASAPARPHERSLPTSIRLDHYPQLQRLAWQLHGVSELSPQDALSLYERNWRHVDQGALQADERALVQSLAASLGGRRLLV